MKSHEKQRNGHGKRILSWVRNRSPIPLWIALGLLLFFQALAPQIWRVDPPAFFSENSLVSLAAYVALLGCFGMICLRTRWRCARKRVRARQRRRRKRQTLVQRSWLARTMAGAQCDERRPRKPRRRRLRIALTLVAFVFSSFVFYWLFAVPSEELKISRETTYFTEPVGDNGTIDYVSALNRRLSEGVAWKSNACIGLLRAIGPEAVDEQLHRRILELIGLDAFPEADRYFLPYGDHVAAHASAENGGPRLTEPLSGEIRQKASKYMRQALKELEPSKAADRAREQIERAARSPWSAEKRPMLAAWLEVNREPLDHAAGAMEKPEFYMPVVSAEESMRLPGRDWGRFLSCVEGIGHGLGARAMLRLHRGELGAAMKDSRALHRLGLHLARQPFLIDALIGINLSRDATAIEAEIAAHPSIAPARLRRHLTWLRELPPIPDYEHVVGLGERAVTLDSLTFAYRRWIGATDKGMEWLYTPSINPNPGFRRVNAFYDRMVAAVGKPSFPERRRAVNSLEEEAKALVELGIRERMKLLFRPPVERAAFWGRVLADQILRVLVPSYVRAETARLRSVARRKMAIVALCLGLHWAEHGEYPEKLAALKSKLLDELPRDPFDGKTLRYKRTESGCVLYSIDANLTDDGGANLIRDDVVEDEGDLVMRLELPH